MKKFYNKIIAPVLAGMLWMIIMLLPYGISKLIVDGMEKSNAKRGW